jgi:hypothetical protein
MTPWLQYLTRFAIGCLATALSFVAMVLFATFVVYLYFGKLESDYNSSPDNTIFVLIASPLLLLLSVAFGVVVGYRTNLPSPASKFQNRPLSKSN